MPGQQELASCQTPVQAEELKKHALEERGNELPAPEELGLGGVLLEDLA